MPSGDFSLINHGTWALSGSDIATAVAQANITAEDIASGAKILIVPTGQGSAAVLEVNVVA